MGISSLLSTLGPAVLHALDKLRGVGCKLRLFEETMKTHQIIVALETKYPRRLYFPSSSSCVSIIVKKTAATAF